MGENELGSLLRTTISVAVYGVIVGLFIFLVFSAVQLVDGNHNRAYKVN
jgi:hypothetical protein